MGKKILFSTLFVAVFWGCEKQLQVEFPPMEKKLVVNCLFRPDSLFKVFVSSGYYPDDSLILAKGYDHYPSYPLYPVENAKVEILEENQLAEELAHVDKGMYKAKNLCPKTGKTYQLRASAKGYPEVVAESYIPNPVYIDSIEFFPDFNKYGEEKFQLIANFTDSKGQNFYSVDLKRLNKNERLNFTSNDPVIGEYNKTLEKNKSFLFDDAIFDNNEYRLSIHLLYTEYHYYWGYDKRFEYRFLSLSQEYFQYFKTLEIQPPTSDIFEEINTVYNNIENGRGIFAGWCYTTDTLELPGKEFFE